MVHDFNNLLSVIFGHGALLAAAFPLHERLRDSVVEINLAAERAAAMTRQLLTFSRRQVIELRPVELNAEHAFKRDIISLDRVQKQVQAHNIPPIERQAWDHGIER